MSGESFSTHGPRHRRAGRLRRTLRRGRRAARVCPTPAAPGVHQRSPAGRLDGEGGEVAGPGPGRSPGDLVPPRDRAGGVIPAVPLGTGEVRGEPLVVLPRAD